MAGFSQSNWGYWASFATEQQATRAAGKKSRGGWWKTRIKHGLGGRPWQVEVRRLR